MMRKLLSVMGASVFVFSAMAIGTGPATAAEPIKIGFMGTYVGGFATLGKEMKDGFKLYLDEIGYKVAGRQIVLYDEDEGGKPAVGLQKARKLVEKDGVHVLAGIVASPVAYAVRDYVNDKKIPLMICNAGATNLTKDQRSPYIFRASFANGQQEAAAGWYAYTKMGARKVVIMGEDYAAGHEKADAFMKAFKALGGEVLDEIYPPFGANDYGPYLAKVANYVGKADLLWDFFPGSDGMHFINQYAAYGLKDKIKLFGDGGAVDVVNLPSEKDAALGVESYLYYGVEYDTPENKRFVKAYQKKYNYDPAGISQTGYVGAKFIVKALEAVKGKIEDREAFMKALRSVKFEGPNGPVRFDEHQNVVENTYILRVQKNGDKYSNYVIDTIPDVGQYWMPPKK